MQLVKIYHLLKKPKTNTRSLRLQTVSSFYTDQHSLFVKALGFTAQVLKVCRTPGPTACLKMLY